MTSVVLLGDLPSTGLFEATAERLVPEAVADPDGLDELLGRICAGGRDGEDGETVVVLYPGWQARKSRKVLSLLRGALPSNRLAGVPRDLPPLALSLVADQLAHMAPYVRPGQLIGLAHRLTETIVAGAWVNSVTRLEHIEAGMGEHLASYLPGSGFMVTAAPNPGVHRITSAEPVPRSGIRPADPVLVVVSDKDGDLNWLQQRLGPVVGMNLLRQVQPQPLSRQYWGTKRYTEFVALCAHPRALEFAVRAEATRICGWCGEPVTLPVCPLCSMAQPGPQSAGQVVPAAEPAPPVPAQPATEIPQVQRVPQVQKVAVGGPTVAGWYGDQPYSTFP